MQGSLQVSPPRYSKNTGYMSIILQGQTTFGYNKAKKRSVTYLKKTGQFDQIQHLPDTYPQHHSQMAKVDIVARAKILKAHLEDAFAYTAWNKTNFTVKAIRRKNSPVLRITHDSDSPKMITEITSEIKEIIKLYFDNTTRCVVTRV